MRASLPLAATLALLAAPVGATGSRSPEPAPATPAATASANAAATARATAGAASRASATGGAARAAARGGRATGGNAVSGGNSISNSYSADVGRSAPAVFAPSLTTSNDTCAGSTSLGGSGLSFGLLFGTSWEYENCTRRANARQALMNGDPAIAHELMCDDDKYRQASLRSGKPCAADRAVPMAPQTVAATQASRPGYCRPRRGESAADRLMRERNPGCG